MTRLRLAVVCALTLCAFAANSLLTRRALGAGLAGAAGFTALRLLSGAAMLWLMTRPRLAALVPAGRRRAGDAAEVASAESAAGWRSAIALFLYAAPFSWAYLQLSAGTGALLLFGAVQATMIGAAVARGDRLGLRTWLGLCVALAGLVFLTLPGVQAPPPAAAAAMLGAGAAWGWYSLRGKRAADARVATAQAFLRAAPLGLLLWLLAALASPDAAAITAPGALLALASGALASGLGYTLWNTALPHLTSSTAAVLQLLVPAIAAAGGVLLLGEQLTSRLVYGGAAILGGVALAVVRPRPMPN